MKKLILALVLLMPTVLAAKEHQVKLLTTDASGQTMIMEPNFLKIEQGDTVRFIPSDASHNAQSLVSPKGGVTFNTPMGKAAVVEFKQEGAYLYKCTPHFALGMLGVIQVGNAVNIDDVKAQWQTLQAGVVMNKERVTAVIAKIKS
ncbi:plastocyanin/azurin family copper-binding protein [Colwellia psychrerythraea]|uniref:Blue (Type 1) copper domain protein n=1 Tax=Colwellia psychrerythraea TaxID=28229 RepID=A0A099KBM7_COLPS|nr:plastocyanin/azurin family copper-binding protein [Colwellia psychrerythraea]KGJ87756.1 blue (type 1) copper domain protein [Colwellia psychrerythraea]